MNKQVIKKAEELLSKCSVCSVASVSENGYPRICILMPLNNVGIKEFWFSTGASGTKVRHFKSNKRAGVTFYQGGDSVTIIGDMDIVENKNVKDSMYDRWSNFLDRHFMNGGKNDPNYCLIHFVAQEATIYIDGVFKTLEI